MTDAGSVLAGLQSLRSFMQDKLHVSQHSQHIVKVEVDGGLGLAIAARYLRNHGWRVWMVESAGGDRWLAVTGKQPPREAPDISF